MKCCNNNCKTIEEMLEHHLLDIPPEPIMLNPSKEKIGFWKSIIDKEFEND